MICGNFSVIKNVDFPFPSYNVGQCFGMTHSSKQLFYMSLKYIFYVSSVFCF